MPRWASPTMLLGASIGAEIFSGNWKYLGVPLGGDRILLVAGLAVLVLGGARLVSERRLRPRPLHYVLLATAAYATVSAIAVHTFNQSHGRFALLDRLGIIPFLMFCLAPLLFRTTAQRKVLLGILIAVGGYLGLISLFQGVGLTSLIFPSYITNPNVGIHFGRARGPFLESAANGLSMYMCAVAALIGLTVWKSARARLTCCIVVVLCGLGIVFTLTRAVWLAAAIGTVAAMLGSKTTRRYTVPGVVVVVLGVMATLQLVPGLASKADTRLQDQQPVWDRYNTNDAAIQMFEAKPVFGSGWQTFTTVGPDYMRQADTYPLTGAGLEVHNVFLSHAAELGVVGSLLWTIALLGAVGGAIVRRGPPELAPWRLGLVAVFVAFLVAANLGPLSYPFPNLLLWTWAGLAGAEHYLGRRRPVTGGQRALEPVSA